MVTRLLIFLTFTLTCAAQPWWTPPVVVVTSTCQTTAFVTNAVSGAAVDDFGTSANTTFCGTQATNVSGQCCGLAFKLRKSSGDISAITYTAQIWTLDSGNLSELLGSSDGVPGDNLWNGTIVKFTFPSPIAITAGTTYGFCLTPSAVAGNYAGLWYGNAPGKINTRWNSAGTKYTTSAGNSSYIEFFYVE